MQAFLSGSAAKRPAESPPGSKLMPAPLTMQALGRLPSWVNIPEAPAAHFQPVHDDGERCDLFKEPRNPQGVMRKWARYFATAGATVEQTQAPRHTACQGKSQICYV